MSQSPQAGQFNSYGEQRRILRKRILVSIPSSGSIQFLLSETISVPSDRRPVSIPSSGSIQFLLITENGNYPIKDYMSQSPQAGQFNSYSG